MILAIVVVRFAVVDVATVANALGWMMTDVWTKGTFIVTTVAKPTDNVVSPTRKIEKALNGLYFVLTNKTKLQRKIRRNNNSKLKSKSRETLKHCSKKMVNNSGTQFENALNLFNFIDRVSQTQELLDFPDGFQICKGI